MAPIPEDNQERPPPDDNADLSAHSNPNLVTDLMDSDFSDDDNDNDNYPDATGYVLLPQEPGENDADSDEERDIESYPNIEGGVDERGAGERVPSQDNHDCGGVGGSDQCTVSNSNITQKVELNGCEAGVSSSAQAEVPVSLHHEFLDKSPEGKSPAYMQMPKLPASNKDSLWNKKRVEKNTALNSAQESKILNAMSGFSIPSENIPDWARNMSQEQWDLTVKKINKPDEKNATATAVKSKSMPTTQCVDDKQIESITHCVDDKERASNSKPNVESWVAEFPDS